jgi:hypothetical protein
VAHNNHASKITRTHGFDDALAPLRARARLRFVDKNTGEAITIEPETAWRWRGCTALRGCIVRVCNLRCFDAWRKAL